MATRETPPAVGDRRLRLEKAREGSAKVIYRVQIGMMGTVVPRWQNTCYRLEWFPRIKTWRIIEVRGVQTKKGTARWQQTILADFGDVSEHDAVGVTLSTLELLGAT